MITHYDLQNVIMQKTGGAIHITQYSIAAYAILLFFSDTFGFVFIKMSVAIQYG